ncbi:Protein strawberry notch -like protein 1 [Toxocara canis]|uniref:Protein strawberry notch-like protein 1 n=1 Tax=Toxocara canis TaxID=6265 RepID=A0A0B2VC45_TOXCA|nr:Protein strawberry notch -like protein 1 [Toxocara canis]
MEDDLLTAALSEAGLEEFIVRPNEAVSDARSADVEISAAADETAVAANGGQNMVAISEDVGSSHSLEVEPMSTISVEEVPKKQPTGKISPVLPKVIPVTRAVPSPPAQISNNEPAGIRIRQVRHSRGDLPSGGTQSGATVRNEQPVRFASVRTVPISTRRVVTPVGTAVQPARRVAVSPSEVITSRVAPAILRSRRTTHPTRTFTTPTEGRIIGRRVVDRQPFVDAHDYDSCPSTSRPVRTTSITSPSGRPATRIYVLKRNLSADGSRPLSRTLYVTRATGNGSVMHAGLSEPRTMIIKRNGRLASTSTVAEVSAVRNQRSVHDPAPLVYERRSPVLSSRVRSPVPHASIYDETGHQYIATSPPPTLTTAQPRLIRTTPALARVGAYSRHPSTIRSEGVRPMLSRNMSTPQLMHSRSTTAILNGERRMSLERRVPIMSAGTSTERIVPVQMRRSSLTAESPLIRVRPQEPSYRASPATVRPSDGRGLVEERTERIIQQQQKDGEERLTKIKQLSPSKIIPVPLKREHVSVEMKGPEVISVSEKIIEPEVKKREVKLTPKEMARKDTVKQDRKTARDQMKAALQAGVDRSNQEIEDEVENVGYAETYADYRPVKLRSGLSHPDMVVETASLSSVEPPDIRYTLSIPEELIDTGAISAVQLEAVIYACQAHEMTLPTGERFGYLIGDGAGVGKGRTIACIIYENYLLGRKRSLWLSVSSDLKFDSQRDLRDIGAKNIKIHALNKFKYAKISGKENGSVKKGCIFATYSSLIGECRSAKGKYRTRLKQLIQWCGKDFDGVIVFDECHRAKNLVPTTGSKPTKTGRVVMELQKALPNARIVYASATGASEPRNMAYMTRLGLWGQGQAFPEFSDFINAVERRGVGAMEIVAMDMKQRGLYLARQLSFRGVSFRVEEVPLSPQFVEMYDDSVKMWLECRRQFQAALKVQSGHERVNMKQIWGQFWAAHQRFFKYLCIGAKVEACVQLTHEAMKANKCVVIGLQSTGEARTLEALDDAENSAPFGIADQFGSSTSGRPSKRPRFEAGYCSDDEGNLSSKEGSEPAENETQAVLVGLIDRHFPLDKSGGGVDIFSSFDRLFSDFDRASKKRNEESGEDSEGAIVGDEETWARRLLDEVKSSSDEDEASDEQRSRAASSDAEEGSEHQSESENANEFNPFLCDLTKEDPWASRQQVISDSPKKKSVKKKKIKKKKKLHKKLEVPSRKTAFESEAMMGTADAFISSSRIIEGTSNLAGGSMVKAELLAAAERLGMRLPPNTLDQLINELGGPEFVAEMTGRKGRVVSREDGEIEYELRHAGADVPLELLNMDEKDKFMKGEKSIAIISEAASSGISLQSDRRALNRRRRVHITLELPWSADKAIQQFGRTHRSNQVNAPEYIFLISELAGEKRFASIVAKRLESLGALTHGDRRATESRDLSQFNVDTRYGRAALDVLLRTVIGSLNPPLIPPPENYKPGNFFADMARYMEGVGLLSCEKGVFSIERESATIPKFLNRILGLPVHAQNALFQYFSDIVADLVSQAKHDGTYDMGIMDLGMGGDEARKLETRVFLGRADNGSFRVEMHKIGVERGVIWEDAYAIWKDHHVDEDGFYLSTVGVNGKQAVALVYGIGKKRLDTGARLFCVTRPSTGRSPKLETHAELTKRFRLATPQEAEPVWKDQYEGSSKMCQHSYFHGRCRSEEQGVYCETGRRARTYFVLSGSVLSVWPIVEEVLSGGMSSREIRKTQRMQIIRVRTQQDHKIVGLLVLPQYVRALVGRLEEHCGRVYVEAKGTATL